MNAADKVSRGLQQLARDLTESVDDLAEEPTAWVLVIFTPGRANYVSNGPRGEVRQALGEIVDGWRQGMPDVPAHEFKG